MPPIGKRAQLFAQSEPIWRGNWPSPVVLSRALGALGNVWRAEFTARPFAGGPAALEVSMDAPRRYLIERM